MSAQPSTPGRVVTLAIDAPNPSRADLVPLRSLVVSRREAGQLLGVSLTTIKELIRSGQLPVIRIGARVLVERSAIRAFIRSARSQTTKGAAASPTKETTAAR